jgi:hypothetical protein
VNDDVGRAALDEGGHRRSIGHIESGSIRGDDIELVGCHWRGPQECRGRTPGRNHARQDGLKITANLPACPSDQNPHGAQELS